MAETTIQKGWLTDFNDQLFAPYTVSDLVLMKTSGHSLDSYLETTFNTLTGNINTTKLLVDLTSDTAGDFKIGSSDTPVNLGVSGVLDVPNGGTGRDSLTTNHILYGNGEGQVNLLAPIKGILAVESDNGIPAYLGIDSDWDEGSSAGPVLNIKVGELTYKIDAVPSANATASGIITTEKQTFSGEKVFAGKIGVEGGAAISGGLTVTGGIDASNENITNVKDPTTALHAANKQYVDGLSTRVDKLVKVVGDNGDNEPSLTHEFRIDSLEAYQAKHEGEFSTLQTYIDYDAFGDALYIIGGKDSNGDTIVSGQESTTAPVYAYFNNSGIHTIDLTVDGTTFSNVASRVGTAEGKINTIFSILGEETYNTEKKDHFTRLNNIDTSITTMQTELNTRTLKTDLAVVDTDNLVSSGVIGITGILGSENGGTGNSNGRIQIGQVAGANIGSNATSEGLYTNASGQASHAEGRESIAVGLYSHAQGYQTTASGQSSFAGGYQTLASGQYSTALGNGTVASGKGALAMGYNNQNFDSIYLERVTDTTYNVYTKIAAELKVIDGKITNIGNNSTGITNNPSRLPSQYQITNNSPNPSSSVLNFQTITQSYYLYLQPGYKWFFSGTSSIHYYYTNKSSDNHFSNRVSLYDNFIDLTNSSNGAYILQSNWFSSRQEQHRHSHTTATPIYGSNSTIIGYNYTHHYIRTEQDYSSGGIIPSSTIFYKYLLNGSTGLVGKYIYGGAYGSTTKITNQSGSLITTNKLLTTQEGIEEYLLKDISNIGSVGSYSFTAGTNTIAKADNQFVIGRNNIQDTTSVFIIGNGSSSTASNAFTVDWSGNTNIAGDLTVGTNTFSDIVSKVGTSESNIITIFNILGEEAYNTDKKDHFTRLNGIDGKIDDEIKRSTEADSAFILELGGLQDALDALQDTMEEADTWIISTILGESTTEAPEKTHSAQLVDLFTKLGQETAAREGAINTLTDNINKTTLQVNLASNDAGTFAINTAVSLGVTGTLDVGNGGTGNASFTENGIVVGGNGTAALKQITTDTGLLLKNNNGTLSFGGKIILSIDDGTKTTGPTIGYTLISSDNQINYTGSSITIPSASADYSGIVTADSQTFGGAKIFNGALTAASLTTAGDLSANNGTFSGALSTGTVTSSLLPTTSYTPTLGSSSSYWNSAYVKELIVKDSGGTGLIKSSGAGSSITLTESNMTLAAPTLTLNGTTVVLGSGNYGTLEERPEAGVEGQVYFVLTE